MAQLIKTQTLPSTISLTQRLLVPSQPFTCSVRNARKAISIKKYREPDFDKKLLLTACEPVKKRDTRPSWEKCMGPVSVTTLVDSKAHPYDILMAEELRSKVYKSQMVVFYHYNIVMKADAISNKCALLDAGFSLEQHNCKVYQLAFQDTKFKHLVPLLTAVDSNALAVSNEINIKGFMDADRKMVNCYVLFAYVYGRLISKVELQKLAKMPSLSQVQGQLLSTLNSSGATLASSINYQLSLLSRGLDARAQQLQPSSGNESGDSQQES